MMMEMATKERDLFRNNLDSYLSELGLEVAATKRSTSSLHEEEEMVTGLQKKVAELT